MGATVKNLFWFRWWLLVGLAVSASASAQEFSRWDFDRLVHYPAHLHKTEYRLVFPNFPPPDYSEADSAQLNLTFDKQFDLQELVLAWNGRSLFTAQALRRNAKWVVEGGVPVLQIDVDALFDSEKISFPRHVRECRERNGRFELWWRAPVSLVKGELVWTHGDALKVFTVPPRVVLDQIAPNHLINYGDDIAVRFHASPEAESFECALDQTKAFAACQSPLFLQELKRGLHSVYFRGKMKDAVGPVTAFSVWIVGKEPRIALKKVDPADYVVGTDTITLAFVDQAAAKKGREIHCQLDNNKAVPCVSPVAFKGLAEGGHIVTIRAARPEFMEPPVVYAFQVQRSVPVLTVTGAPAELSNLTDAAFAFSADRPASFRCGVDGAEPTDCTSPWDLTKLGEGVHDAVLYAVDNVGRASAHYTFQWRIDLTAPQFSFVANPVRPRLATGNLSVGYSATEPVSNLSCDLNGVALASCASPLVLAGLADGPYHLRLSGQDSVGNVGQFSYDFSVDSQSPVVEVRRVLPVNSPSSQNAASFEFSANELSDFSCALDGGAPALCQSPVAFADLAEGAHRLTVFAQDLAGNSSQATAAWIVDQTAPVVAVDSALPADPVTESQSLSLAVSASEAAQLFFQLDSGAETAFVSPLVVNDLIEGRHRIQLRAQDLAGNVSAPLLYEWTVAMTAQVSIKVVANPGPVTVAQSNSFTFEGTHAIEYRCAMDGGPVAVCTSPFAIAGLADGDHAFTVRGVNVANVEGPVASYTWRIEAPSAVVSLSSSVADGGTSAQQAAQFSFSSNGINFQCSLDGAGFAPCASPFGTSGLNDGGHSFRVFAYNVRGVAGAPAQVSWNVQTPAAVITLGAAVPPQAVTRSSTLSLSFSSSSVANFCALDAQAAAPCTSPVAYNGLGDGPHAIRINGKSPGGTLGAVATYSWSVDQVAPIVTIDSTNPATSPTAQVFMTVTFHADEPSTFLCALDGAAPAACSSPWTTSVTTDGSHSIAIWATDAVGNPSVVPATHTWTVDRSFTCSNFSVTQVSRTSVMVSWRTSSSGSSVAKYGLGSNRNGSVTGASNVTQHDVLVSSLGTNNFYSAQGQSSTNDGRSCQTSAIFFTTPP